MDWLGNIIGWVVGGVFVALGLSIAFRNLWMMFMGSSADTKVIAHKQRRSDDDRRELYRFRQFFIIYPRIVETVTPQLIHRLSFSHLAELIELSDDIQRRFYEIECIRGNWSVRELRRQIANKALRLSPPAPFGCALTFCNDDFLKKAIMRDVLVKTE